MNEGISNYTKSLVQDPWFAIISILLGFVGIILAITFYLKGKKVKKPKIAMRTINLFRDSAEKIAGLQIIYHNLSISNVTVTKLAIWNDGKETINEIDIAKADPIIIKSKGNFEILESKIIYTKNVSNQIKLRKIDNDKKISLLFDYLDYGEGAVIQILHTGNSSNDIEFSGTIKGVGEIALNKMEKGNSIFLNTEILTHGAPRVFGVAYLTMGIILVVSSIIMLFSKDHIIEFNNIDKIVIFTVCMVPAILFILLGLNISKKRVPKGFEAFEDNI